jgi:hypothetical protein
MKAERKFTKCKAPTTMPLAEKFCANFSKNPQIYRTKNTITNQNMPNITQFGTTPGVWTNMAAGAASHPCPR